MHALHMGVGGTFKVMAVVVVADKETHWNGTIKKNAGSSTVCFLQYFILPIFLITKLTFV